MNLNSTMFKQIYKCIYTPISYNLDYFFFLYLQKKPLLLIPTRPFDHIDTVRVSSFEISQKQPFKKKNQMIKIKCMLAKIGSDEV